MIDRIIYKKHIFRQLVICLRGLHKFQCRVSAILPCVVVSFRQLDACVEAYPLISTPATRKLALLGRLDFETLSPKAVVPNPG